jgi:hypothetical protein
VGGEDGKDARLQTLPDVRILVDLDPAQCPPTPVPRQPTMSLIVRVSVEPAEELVGTLVIQRQEDLRPGRGFHAYVASRLDEHGNTVASARLRHRYTDGAWVLVAKALKALKSNIDGEGND